jgi:hypothetical protein
MDLAHCIGIDTGGAHPLQSEAGGSSPVRTTHHSSDRIGGQHYVGDIPDEHTLRLAAHACPGQVAQRVVHHGQPGIPFRGHTDYDHRRWHAEGRLGSWGLQWVREELGGGYRADGVPLQVCSVGGRGVNRIVRLAAMPCPRAQVSKQVVAQINRPGRGVDANDRSGVLRIRSHRAGVHSTPGYHYSNAGVKHSWTVGRSGCSLTGFNGKGPTDCYVLVHLWADPLSIGSCEIWINQVGDQLPAPPDACGCW